MAKVALGKDTSGRPLVVDDTWLAKLRVAEAALGFKFTIVQGAYRGSSGAAASAGTHDAAGVVDLRSWNLPTSISPQKAVLELRKAGLIAWYRTKAQGFDPHFHTLDYGCPGMSPSAQRQVTSWLNGRNGLASNGPDDGPRVTIPKVAPKVGAPVKPFRIDGVDISHWQAGALDFGKAQAAGVRWVYHKCTEGTGYTDDRYSGRRAEVGKAGLPFGAYHFARPASSGGKAQALFFLSKAKPVAGDMRPMLDLEDQGGLSRAALTAWVGAFVVECVAQTGVAPFIYTPFDLDKTFDCPLWTARYNDANAAPKIPAPWKSYTVHQFSNGVNGRPNTVAGLGNVDLNTMAGDPAELTRTFTLGGEDMPLSDVDLKKIQAMIPTADQVADAVLNRRVVVNRNPGGSEGTTSLSAMLTNIELSGDRVEQYTKPATAVEPAPEPVEPPKA